MNNTFKQAMVSLIPPGFRGSIRAALVGRRIRKFIPREVEHFYGGTKFKVHITDPLAAGWYDVSWGELAEIAALSRSRLRAGARVFDIGAHQGVVAMMLAQAVQRSGSVIAVEPSPHNAAIAAQNFKSNGMTQITILQAAICDRSGPLKFNQMLNGQLDYGAGLGELVVDGVTIDELAERFGNPTIVYLDVEGAECLALAGAKRVLTLEVDFFVEVHVGCGLEKLGGSVEKVLSFFDSERFTLLVRGEKDDEFRPLVFPDPSWKDRFFLLALCKEAIKSEPAPV